MQMKHVQVIMGIDDVFFYPDYRDYWERLTDFLKHHTKLKITLFTVANYRYKQPSRLRKFLHRHANIPYPSYKPETFILTRFPEFIQTLSSLQKTGRVEIAGHGWTHCGEGTTGAREFATLSAKEINEHIVTMNTIFEDCGLPKPTGFSSPGWEYNDDLFSALEKMKCTYVAASLDTTTPISSKKQSNQAGIKGLALTHPQRITKHLVNIPRNVTLNADGPSRALEIAKNNGIVSIHAHLYPIGVSNSLTEDNLTILHTILTELEKKYIVKYLLFGDIARANL